MYERDLKKEILYQLSQNPAVVILGARQIGKTMLAQKIAAEHDSVYLDLENPADLRKLDDPEVYLNLHADKLVILDEVQNYPELFKPLRGIIDKRRQEGRGNGRFLLLGSASNQLMNQTESLAGRIHYSELYGLNPFEVGDLGSEALRALWLRGGFPDSYSALDNKASLTWRDNFIRTYLERDMPQFGLRVPAATLEQFWILLAHSQGGEFNASKIASLLGVASITASRYLDSMVDLLLVRKLRPLHANVGKRLVKSPRVYIRDSGVTHALLRIGDFEDLLSHEVKGKSWESFVIEHIIASLPVGATPYFYRTSAGAEIDLIIDFKLGNYWAIEIKSTRTPNLSKGFYSACDDLQVKRKFIIYTGDETFTDSKGVMIMSLPSFIEELRSR